MTRSNSGYILSQLGFCDLSNVELRERREKNDSNVLSSWKDSATTKIGISAGRTGCREELQVLSFGHVKFDIQVELSSRQLDRLAWNLEARSSKLILVFIFSSVKQPHSCSKE